MSLEVFFDAGAAGIPPQLSSVTGPDDGDDVGNVVPAIGTLAAADVGFDTTAGFVVITGFGAVGFGSDDVTANGFDVTIGFVAVGFTGDDIIAAGFTVEEDTGFTGEKVADFATGVAETDFVVPNVELDVGVENDLEIGVEAGVTGVLLPPNDGFRNRNWFTSRVNVATWFDISLDTLAVSSALAVVVCVTASIWCIPCVTWDNPCACSLLAAAISPMRLAVFVDCSTISFNVWAVCAAISAPLRI